MFRLANRSFRQSAQRQSAFAKAGSKDDRTEAQVNLVMLGAPGLAMAIWGALTYSRSKNAAHAFEDRTEKEKKKKDDEDRPFLPAPTWNFTQPPQATVRGPTVRQ